MGCAVQSLRNYALIPFTYRHPMKNIDPEFAFQSRELGAQIEDTLGDPPDRKNYARVIQSLLGEFARGTAIDDVNLLSFALFDHLSFDDPAGLLAQCAKYDQGNAAKMLSMVSCADADANKALQAVCANSPELARKAILTAFLFKNQKRWLAEDNSLQALQKEEDEGEDEEEDQLTPGQDFEQLFDEREDENER